MSLVRLSHVAAGVVLCTCCAATAADGVPVQLDPVQVTATRTSDTIESVPLLVTVVKGDDIRARGATDLRSALAGVAGVEISAGGDGGPAGAVPALWGLREVDAFLLVIDGVPSGGAFNPALTTLDLTNIERIEVMRGSAPVMYGATSFVGVIHVIHYAAGEAPGTVSVGFGGPASNMGSTIASASTSFGGGDRWGHSITLNGEKRNFSDDNAGFSKGHALYRTGGTLGTGKLRVDFELTKLDQDPDSPVVRQGAALANTPLDANYNPKDAKFEETRGQVNVGYVVPLGTGTWDSLASLDQSKATTNRGFLGDPATGASAGYEQERELSNIYLDSHMTWNPAKTIDLSIGIDALLGKVEQESETFMYTVDPATGRRPDSGEAVSGKEGEAESERAFWGVYVQSGWHLLPTVDVVAGLRVNATQEEREGEQEVDVDGDGIDDEVQGKAEKKRTRLSGMLGASWKAFEIQGGGVTLYTNYRNTYKPAAFEFGPENEAEIPKFETAASVEAGAKTRLMDGRVNLDVSVFDMDFENVFLQEGNDIRKTRLRGVEGEAQWWARPTLLVAATAAYHDSIFRDATINDGADDVSGNDLELAPHWISSLSALYNPTANGVFASADFSHVGKRYLNKRNTAQVPSYATYDASVGYRIAHCSFAVTGHNLSDARAPVSESEFSEVTSGASSYYRLPARVVMGSFTYTF